MRSVICDYDFFLDLFANREPFNEPAAKLFRKIEAREVTGFISSFTFPILFHMLAQEIGPVKAAITLAKLRIVFKVAAVDEKVIDLALASDFKDIEDAIMYYTLIQSTAECLISRNKAPFAHKRIPVLTPEEFLAGRR